MEDMNGTARVHRADVGSGSGGAGSGSGGAGSVSGGAGSGSGSGSGDGVSTFALALELAGALGTGRLVSATYPLTRFEEAVAHAGAAGRRGAVKIAFDVREEKKGHTR
jgi:hypothetical protein